MPSRYCHVEQPGFYVESVLLGEYVSSCVGNLLALSVERACGGVALVVIARDEKLPGAMAHSESPR